MGVNYSLLLFDEVLLDTTGLEVACFMQELAHRQSTPFITVKKSDDFELLASTIIDLLHPQE
jgi:hypothetical protein